MTRHIATACGFILSVLMGGGCETSSVDPAPSHAAGPVATSHPGGLQGKPKEHVVFGQARLAIGMSKDQTLDQIRRSRSQYQPLKDEQSTELFVAEPSDETIASDIWFLTCPSRNSHVLGGGGGIRLKLRFRDDRVVSIDELPWLAG